MIKGELLAVHWSVEWRIILLGSENDSPPPAPRLFRVEGLMQEGGGLEGAREDGEEEDEFRSQIDSLKGALQRQIATSLTTKS